MRRSKALLLCRYLNAFARIIWCKNKSVKSFHWTALTMACFATDEYLCVCVLVGHSRLVKISNTHTQHSNEREIHARRRPILRVARLINGLLREFAIYYLAATAAASQPANTLLNRLHRNDEKTINYFSLWFSMACVRPYPLKDKDGQTGKLGRSPSCSRTVAAAVVVVVVVRSELQL